MYRFQPDNPRFMVQFGSTDDVHKVIASWKPVALGGTAVRGTILPSEIPAGMVRGVTLTCPQMLSRKLFQTGIAMQHATD